MRSELKHLLKRKDNAHSGSSEASVHSMQESEERLELAGQWQLMWWRFRRHKVALIGGVMTICLYLIAIFAEFLAPFPKDVYNARYTYAPPQALHLFERTDQGLRFRPFVYDYKVTVDPSAMRRVFVPDTSRKHYVALLVKGAPYKLLGIFSTDRHLIGPLEQEAPMFLLGADRMGRDLSSRIVYGTRISMSIGLVGVALSLFLGILLGGISGFYGGAVDLLLQRVIEFLRSIPTIPLWMGLAAAIPLTWPPLRVYFGITIILSLIGWTGLARVVRGKFLSLRTEDFVIAARLDGSSEVRVIMRYMVPAFLSHIIAEITLAIPHMILSETSLSFLGIGLRPPIVSWGVLLNEAQNIRAVATAPWLLLPGVPIFLAVLSMNFLGDGLRDAADPYEH